MDFIPATKEQFCRRFQAWLPRVKVESGWLIKVLGANRDKEFILVKLRSLCKERDITIWYIALYVHEENGLAKQRWHTMVIIKDSMLIDSGLRNGFWAEAMEITNYLQNRLEIKTWNHGNVILEETWTNQRQNLQHIWIFGSLALCNIPDKKRTRLDYQRVWQDILIGYSPDGTKHFCIWSLQKRQIVIVSKPYVDELKQRAKLLKK